MEDYLNTVSRSRSDDPKNILIRTALDRGEFKNKACEPKFVCHLSTMPFLSNAMEKNFKKKFREIEFVKHTNCNHCQMESHEALKKNCPCPRGLEHICYLEAVKGIGVTRDEKSIDQREIVYCSDQCNILGGKYPARMREAAGITGWDKCRDLETIIKVLKVTAWGSTKRIEELKTYDWIRKTEEKYTFEFVKHCVEQSIYCVDSIILMALMTNTRGLGNYAEIARISAECFEEAFYSYLKNRRFETDASEIRRLHPVQILKLFHAKVKDVGRSMYGQERRLSWGDLSYLDESATKRFIQRIIDPIIVEAMFMTSDYGQDYTLSVEWTYLTCMLAQSRATSYLPTAMKLQKREDFRRNLAREPTVLTRDEKIKEALLIQDALAFAGLPLNGLMDLNSKEFGAVEERVKQTASVEDPVLAGGKQETARATLRMALEKKWEIEYFDLFTGEVTGTFRVEGLAGDHQRDLFWISFGIISRWMKATGRMSGRLKTWDGFIISGKLFSAAIVHIGEQGKERNLVKCSAVLTWFLGPGSRVFAKYLAKHKTHNVGLTGASDAWKLDKRISPFSSESHFIYDKVQNGQTRPGVVAFELDLTESTDFMERARALAQFAGLVQYTSFPKHYGKMMAIVYAQPMRVREVITADEGFLIERTDYHGDITEGGMMGIELTKILLHLSHFRAGETARRMLAVRGLFERKLEQNSIPTEKEIMVYPNNPQVSS